MNRCTVRHRPGSAAQRACPVHGALARAVAGVASEPAARVRIWHVNQRREAAADPNTPLEVLEILARDDVDSVRRAVATSPYAPASVLETLAQDDHPYVRLYVCVHPGLTARVLEILARDKSRSVRASAARHPSTPVHTLEQIARAGGTGIAEVVRAQIHRRISAHFGIARSNTGALDMLRGMPWQEMTREDPRVQLVLVLHGGGAQP